MPTKRKPAAKSTAAKSQKPPTPKPEPAPAPEPEPQAPGTVARLQAWPKSVRPEDQKA